MKCIVFLCSILLAIQVFAESKPNVVILYADDMGVADVSYSDKKAKIQTPSIDRLAASGMTFTDGHSSSGICTPSRYALLTGQYHWRRFHGIVNAFEPSVFEANEYTIARMFKSQGYKTGGFGKWHLGWDWSAIRKEGESIKAVDASAYNWSSPFPGGPIDHGFDYYFGDGTINFPPYTWIENDRFVYAPTKPVIKSEPLAGGGVFRPGPMATEWNPYDVLPKMTEKTVKWIEEQDGKQPFFAYVAFNSPHYPIVPNKPFQGKSKAGYYGDFVIETDAMVNKILDALDRKGFAENTIVIFTADNGAERHAFQRLSEFDQWSSGDFRGLKRDVYEGGHRVPFIVRWPKAIQAGAVSKEVISQIDLAATFASIIGYPLSNEVAVDSYDFLSVWKGEKYKSPIRAATVQNTHPKKYAIREGDWVFINASSGAQGPEDENYLSHFKLSTFPDDTKGLLFNLKKDPRQSKNLYDECPDKVASMSALLESSLTSDRTAPLRDITKIDID